MTVDWRREYASLAESLPPPVPEPALFALGFDVCIDAMWQVTPQVAERLEDGASHGTAPEPARELCRELVDRMRHGRGGELFVDWPEGAAWFDTRLPAPERLQVGGTCAQAAWTFAELGIRSVIPLVDRSPAQLGVLHPMIEVLDEGGPRPVGGQRPDGAASGEDAQPGSHHYILEYRRGDHIGGELIPRSSRVIVRFSAEGIERDRRFLEQQRGLLPQLRGAVLSGMNAIAPGDEESWRFVEAVLRVWETGAPDVHCELADYDSMHRLRRVLGEFGPRVSSCGLSLSELAAAAGDARAPIAAARLVAERFDLPTLVVHADGWAFALHDQDEDVMRRRLMTGNLLAANRAATGAPQPQPTVPDGAAFPDDLPHTQRLGRRWRFTSVPAPWLRRPRSTIGLGDTFVAGFLLGALTLDTPRTPHTPSAPATAVPTCPSPT